MSEILDKIKNGTATVKLSPDTLENFRDLLEKNDHSVLMGYSKELKDDSSWDGATGYVFYSKKGRSEIFYLEKASGELEVLDF